VSYVYWRLEVFPRRTVARGRVKQTEGGRSQGQIVCTQTQTEVLPDLDEGLMQMQGGVVITAIGFGATGCNLHDAEERNGCWRSRWSMVDGAWIVSSRNLDTRGPRRGVSLNTSVLA
jgi:hypothetical protein